MIPVQGFPAYFFALFPGLGHFYLQRHVKAFLYGLPFWFVVVLFVIIASQGGPGSHDMLPFLFFGDLILWVICFVDMLSTINRLKANYMHAAMYQSGADPYGRPYYDPMKAQQIAYRPAAAAPYPPSFQQAQGEPASGVMPDPTTGFAAPPPPPESMHGHYAGQPPYGEPYDPERSKLMAMSIVPGLGHFHLGLMQRGMSTMALFFGIIVFILFIASMTSGSFLAFLLALPIVWFYTLFDALNLYKRKKAGETITDRSLFDDFYLNGESNRRNRTVATLLAIFPGAGHLYLGIQRRGIQLMIGFLVSLYLLDVLRLSFFLFLIPIFWFFSFFDALQIISRFEKEELKDVPIVNSVFHYRRWIGFALILMGVYFVIYRIAPEVLSMLYRDYQDQIWQVYSLIRNYTEVGVVSLILIIAGIFLLFRRKKTMQVPMTGGNETEQ